MRWCAARSARVLAALAGLAGCGSKSSPVQCLHPCDLAQTAQIEITGKEQAVAVTVSDLCFVASGCAPTVKCSRIDVVLQNGGPGPGGPDKVCHVRIVGESGAVIERDLTATYLDDPCCSGFEFMSDANVSVSFAPPDAGP